MNSFGFGFGVPQYPEASGAPPPPSSFNLLTEDGDTLTTEDGDSIRTE